MAPQPGQGNIYGGPPNGYGMEDKDAQLSPRQYNLSRSSPAVQEPSPRAVLDGYSTDIMNGFPGEPQRYNPVSASKSQNRTATNHVPRSTRHVLRALRNLISTIRYKYICWSKQL